MKSLTRNLLVSTFVLSSFVSCKIDEFPGSKIEIVASADFNKDEKTDFVGYVHRNNLTSKKSKMLVVAKGENVLKGKNGFYVLYDRFSVIEPYGKNGKDFDTENVSAEDLNHDGLPDISYDRILGNKITRKIFYNQGNEKFKGETGYFNLSDFIASPPFH